MNIRKYWLVAKNTWDEVFAYRLNFAMWRVRTVVQLLTLYFLWLGLLPKGATLLGYTQSVMLTYILGTSLIGSIVLASRSYAVGDDINNGNLSNFLIRPINYFAYWFAKDVGDKAMNICFSVFELTVLFLMLHPPVFFQTNIFYLILSSISIIIAIVLYFFFNLLLGFIGFWSPEVWGPRFIFMILLSFFAGSLFPLDILPKPVFIAFQFLPFSYLLYFPLKIYLGRLTMFEILTGLLTSLVWTFLIYKIVQFVWAKGLRVYTAYGR